MEKKSLAARYSADAATREVFLEEARLSARLTDPTILPPKTLPRHPETGELLPQNFQSIGAQGVLGLGSLTLLDLCPPDIPFFEINPAVEVINAPGLAAEEQRAMMRALRLREMTIMSALETGTVGVGRRRRQSKFRSALRQAIDSVLITGDTLVRMDEDLRFQVFRRDRYTTKRDSCGDVLSHTTIQTLDALSLTDAEATLQKAGLPVAEFKQKAVTDRMVDLYTHTEWNPLTHKWVVRQELNKVEISESEEPVTSFIAAPYKLNPEEDYGRGFIEVQCRGDLLSLDTLREKLLDWAALASYMLTCIDPGSEFRERDLQKPTGSTSRGARVSDGKVQDVAFLALGEKLRDFGIVDATATRLEQSLNKTMLNELAMQPHQERVTAAQINRIHQSVRGAHAGVYATISDDIQIPIVDWASWVLAKKGKLRPLPEGAVEVRTITGLLALGRQAKAQSMAAFVAWVKQLSPTAAARLDDVTVIDAMARYANIVEPGLIKSDEQVAEEIRQAAKTQLAMTAGEQAIKTTGNVIENAAAAPAAA